MMIMIVTVAMGHELNGDCMGQATEVGRGKQKLQRGEEDGSMPHRHI
jgi:hypothetical protein